MPRNPWKHLGPGPWIAPSILACDFARLGQQADQAVAAGADVLHVDIMDGHFVPNLSVGVPVVESLRKYTKHPLDVHIMVSDPEYFLERFAEAGADSITFHIETTTQGDKLIRRLRELGLGAAVTLKPGTPAEAIRPVVEAVDMVLVMTVEPGYGGQKFMADQLPKIQAIRKMLRDDQRLQVDGGINAETARRCASAGADVFVAGNSVFGSADLAGAIRDIRAAAQAGQAETKR